MKYMTAYVQSGSECNGIILQQLVRKDGVPVCFLAILPRKQNHDDMLSAQNQTSKATEQLLAWFYDIALHACVRGDAGRCVDRVLRLFQKVKPPYQAAFFAMGEQCFYAWQGQAGIRLFQLGFGRVRERRLTEPAMQGRERAILEPGAGILLGNHDFFAHLAPEDLTACLQLPELKTETQLERHLAEAAIAAKCRGAGDIAAVFLLPADN